MKNLILSFLSLFALALILAIALGISWQWATQNWKGPGTNSSNAQKQSIIYEIPNNTGLHTLSIDLEKKGLIPNADLFRLYLRITGKDRQVRSGYYELPSSTTIANMSHLLTEGEFATKKVTISEGKASWEYYGILKNHYALDSLKLDSLMTDTNFINSCGIEASSLEGYMFPDTYLLPYKVSEEEILKVLTGRFHEVLSQLNLESPFFREYGLHKWLTIASIVEKEAAVRSEQALIAGVFYNRLEKGWPLGADPTVRYFLKKLTGPLYVSELNRPSPYNTRKFAGIPPGPICNPGLKAMKATLNPAETEYMFFVAKDDGTREHFFSVRQSQHNRYKRIAAQNRNKRSTQ